MKLLISFGTRPEAIKLAPLIKYFRDQSNLITVNVCSTGQHRELLYPVFELFDIKPDISLHVIDLAYDLPSLVSAITVEVSKVIQQVTPSLLLVQGDTASALGSALAGYYNKIPVCHLEAGLRSYDFYEPFPEEMHRRVITQLSTFHLAPNEVSRSILLKEGISASKVHIVGNTLEDAFAFVQQKHLEQNIWEYPENSQIILVTQHRRENIGQGVENLCKALIEIVEKNPRAFVFFVVYPNPLIKNTVSRLLCDIERIRLLEPLRYDMFIDLLQLSDLVLTDSGGVCEEAAFIGIPTFMTRRVTERQYLIDQGAAQLIGNSVDMIVEQTLERLRSRTKIMQRTKLMGGETRFIAHLIIDTILPNLL